MSEALIDGTTKVTSCSLTDLDLSRNRLCHVAASGDAKEAGESMDGLSELARATAQSIRLSTLALSRCGLDDAAGAVFCNSLSASATKPEPPSAGVAVLPTKGPPPAALMKLDLSHNHLRAEFGTTLTTVLSVCPALVDLNLKGNGLGVEGGKAAGKEGEPCCES